ncbi:MAG: aromatic-L-amino-acid decarboxylase, partial [Myxococcota bacterium]
ARSFEAKVRSDPRFICVGDRHAALVCFRLGSGDGPTRALLGAVNATGEVFLTHTTVAHAGGSVFVIRMAIGGVRTEARHVDRAWELLQALAPSRA